MGAAIRIEGLKKTYKDIEALKNVSLDIPKGSFFGLLGPNGAGKTTLIKCITGLASFEEGTVTVHGKDVVLDYKETRRMVGLSQQDIYMDPYFPILSVLIYQAGYFGIPKSEAEPRATELLKRMNLLEKKDLDYRKLSGGMKRKVEICKALMHDPDIIILDEPTAALDVQTRRDLWEFIGEEKDKGKTVILTTHYIEEAQQHCDRVAIMNKGEILSNTTLKDLFKHAKKTITATYTDKPKKVNGAAQENNTLSFTMDAKKDEHDIIAKLLDAGSVTGIETKTQSLEEIFLELTEEQG